ncbi:MAG: beta-galactosidase [Armatimonadia bacterium]
MMKRRDLRLALIALAALMPVSLALAADPIPGNLLTNPGFEQAEVGFPVGWRTFDEKAKGLVALDRQEVFAGTYSLRVTGDPAEAWLPLFSGGIKTEPNGEYTLGCFSKSAIKSGTQILFALREITADGQSIRFSQVPIPLQGEWAFHSQKLKLTEKTASVQVFIVLQKCDGKVWFDDLVLVKGDLPNLEALRARKKQPATGPAAQELPLYTNILPNAGLESLVNDQPQQWTFVGAGDQQGAADQACRFAGKTSFRQTHGSGGLPASYLHPSNAIKLEPNNTYRLSAWVRTSPGARSAWTSIPKARRQRVEGACLQLIFLDEKGESVTEAWSAAVQTDGQWQPLAVVGIAPGNTVSADIRLYHGDLRGSSWFDSPRLERVEDAEDLQPLWALPTDQLDTGSLPPTWQMTGKAAASLVADGTSRQYSVALRNGAAAVSELVLPPVDASFPGSFRISGEARQVAGEGIVKLVMSSLSADGTVLARQEQPLALTADWANFIADYTPEPMAATFTVAVALSGDGTAVDLRQPVVQRTSRSNLAEYAAQTLKPSASATAAAAAPPKLQFAPYKGLPTLSVNGERLSPTQYWYADPPKATEIEACRRAGLIQTLTLADIDWSTDPPGIDWTAFDAQVHEVLKGAPQAWLMLCSDTTAEHGKVSWVRSHPDQAYVNDLSQENVKSYSGESRAFPSFASTKWLDDVNRMLVMVIKHVQASDYASRVIGYQLSGYEWFQWEWSSTRMDASSHMRDAFRRWLKAKYGTTESLQKAWGKPGTTFETVQLPTTAERRQTVDGVFRDPVAQRHVTDFSRFYNELIADVLISQARTVKQTAGPETLVSCFYGYDLQMFDGLTRESSAHLAVRKLLDSKLIELPGAPTDGYLYERGIGGTGGFMTLTGTYPLHGALYMDQPDFRTHWSPQDVERTATTIDDVNIFRREFALALTNGVPIQYLDFSRDWTIGDPRLVEELRRFTEIERFALTLDRTAPAEGMAVVFSEETADFIGTDRTLFDGGLIYHQRPLLYRGGMPHRYFLLSDLADPALPDYRVWVFPNAFRLTAEERALIQRKCMRNGNVVVFCYAPGIVDEKSVATANMERLLGFKLEKLTEPRYAKVKIAPTAACPWLKDSNGLTYGQGLWSPLYAAVDPTVQVLGKYAESDKPGLVWKDFGSYKVVYSGAPLLPPDLWRDLGRLAGANIYCETNDAVYADGNFIGLHARTPGLKRLNLPRRADVYDLVHRKVIARGVTSIELKMKGFDTALFYIGDAAKAEAFFSRGD